jgi:hypothetical protein
MPELRTAIADAVARAHKEMEDRARRKGYGPAHLVPKPPATDAQIGAYEQSLGLRLPASYRAFLSLFNGYEGLVYGGDMLSIDSVIPGGASYDAIVEWKRLCADYGSGEVLDGIVIANSRQPNKWVYIDPNRRSAPDEMVIVRYMGDTSEEFRDLLGLFDYVVYASRLDLGKGTS